MNPSDYISKAIHAINTDQPNLAMLYMKRGYLEMKLRRRDPMLDARDGINVFAEAFNSLIPMFEEVANVFMKFGQNLQRVYDREFYALVADNEG